MRPLMYRLDGRTPVPDDTGRGQDDRCVAADSIGAVLISTVFLCLDHNYGAGPPLVFETMIFGGPLANHQWRYSTWDQAEAGHARAVSYVRNGLTEAPR